MIGRIVCLSISRKILNVVELWTDLEEIFTTDRQLDLVEVIKFRELRA